MQLDATPAPFAPRRPSVRVRVRLRAATLCAESTIVRWWRERGAVRPAIDLRLTEAARDLGILHPDEEGGAR
jgi:hypothetical protein